METSSGLERRRSMGQDEVLSRPLRRIEFYWLCENCASKMTLICGEPMAVSVRANSEQCLLPLKFDGENTSQEQRSIGFAAPRGTCAYRLEAD